MSYVQRDLCPCRHPICPLFDTALRLRELTFGERSSGRQFGESALSYTILFCIGRSGRACGFFIVVSRQPGSSGSAPVYDYHSHTHVHAGRPGTGHGVFDGRLTEHYRQSARLDRFGTKLTRAWTGRRKRPGPSNAHCYPFRCGRAT